MAKPDTLDARFGVNSMSHRDRNYIRLVAAFFLAGYLVLAGLDVRAVVLQGDEMIGLYPVVLLSFPAMMAGGVASLLLLLIRGARVIGVAMLIGSLSLAMVIFNAHRIEQYAWHRTLQRYGVENESALSGIATEIEEGELFATLYQEEKLTALDGFRWYGRNHIVAPRGIYYGFRLAGVPHVRIQKIRHGWAGVAKVNNPDELARLKSTAPADVRYTEMGSEGWLHWLYPDLRYR
ncbi:MAG TPA: hypothetical protein PLA50_20755 [Bacteroidia bacterium]|nr:hypothetical protein [Bacteroidia bacterium]